MDRCSNRRMVTLVLRLFVTLWDFPFSPDFLKHFFGCGRFISILEVREEISISMVKSISLPIIGPKPSSAPKPGLMGWGWSDLLLTVIKEKTNAFLFSSYSFPFSELLHLQLWSNFQMKVNTDSSENYWDKWENSSLGFWWRLGRCGDTT